eukprot:14110-Chlamydomonas_euryale.AAC.1
MQSALATARRALPGTTAGGAVEPERLVVAHTLLRLGLRGRVGGEHHAATSQRLSAGPNQRLTYGWGGSDT